MHVYSLEFGPDRSNLPADAVLTLKLLFLVREIQAKLAYVDETIVSSHVGVGLAGITLNLRQSVDTIRSEHVVAKVNHMVKATYDPQSPQFIAQKKLGDTPWLTYTPRC